MAKIKEDYKSRIDAIDSYYTDNIASLEDKIEEIKRLSKDKVDQKEQALQEAYDTEMV